MSKVQHLKEQNQDLKPGLTPKPTLFTAIGLRPHDLNVEGSKKYFMF